MKNEKGAEKHVTLKTKAIPHKKKQIRAETNPKL